jgi:IclR family transcriptional regulator, acetate operon repressor
MAPEDRGGPPSTIDRALDLLRLAVNTGGPLSLADAAAACGLPKPTAHRILRVLASHGLLHQGRDRSYRLGPELYRLAGKALSQVEYVSAAEDTMDALQAVTPETLHFAVLAGNEVVFVLKKEGRQPYRMASMVGMRVITHCTSIGKVVLAYTPEERRAALLELPLARRTPHTITSMSALESELEVVHERGFAIDDEENEENVRCVAAPVFNALGTVIGGISIAAPTFNLSLDDAIALAPELMRTAVRISLALGAEEHSLPASLGRLAAGA